MFKKQIRIMVIFCLLIFVTGCMAAKNQLANLQEGQSTAKEVQQLFGSPVKKMFNSKGATWEYSFNQLLDPEIQSHVHPQKINQLLLKVTFNEDDVYVGFSFDLIEITGRAANIMRPPGPAPMAGKRPQFHELDINSDKRISRKEFPGPDPIFQKFDMDNSGYIELDEAPQPSVIKQDQF